MDHEKGFWTSTAGMLTAIGGLVGAIAAVLTALVATGTIGGSTSAASERTSYPSAAITVVSASSDYPEVVRNNFVNSCTGAGSPASTCNCALSLIERTV